MKAIDLYRYEKNEMVIVTPNKENEDDNSSLTRLIADEGMILQNGNTKTEVVDTYNPEEWTEIKYEETETSE